MRTLSELERGIVSSTILSFVMKVGERQTIETLINEEDLLFAKYLRNEKQTWHPRIALP